MLVTHHFTFISVPKIEYCLSFISRWRTVSASSATSPTTSIKKYLRPSASWSRAPITWGRPHPKRGVNQNVWEGKSPKVCLLWLAHSVKGPYLVSKSGTDCEFHRLPLTWNYFEGKARECRHLAGELVGCCTLLTVFSVWKSFSVHARFNYYGSAKCEDKHCYCSPIGTS